MNERFIVSSFAMRLETSISSASIYVKKLFGWGLTILARVSMRKKGNVRYSKNAFMHKKLLFRYLTLVFETKRGVWCDNYSV